MWNAWTRPTASWSVTTSGMLLLDRAGLGARRRRTRRTDLPSREAVFVTNSSGIAPVDRVDDKKIPQNPEIAARLTNLYASIPWDII